MTDTTMNSQKTMTIRSLVVLAKINETGNVHQVVLTHEQLNMLNNLLHGVIFSGESIKVSEDTIDYADILDGGFPLKGQA